MVRGSQGPGLGGLSRGGTCNTLSSQHAVSVSLPGSPNDKSINALLMAVTGMAPAPSPCPLSSAGDTETLVTESANGRMKDDSSRFGFSALYYVAPSALLSRNQSLWTEMTQQF